MKSNTKKRKIQQSIKNLNEKKEICVVISFVFTPGETIASAQRVERQNGELHPQHQLHHLR